MSVDLERLHVTFLAGTLEPGGAEQQLFYMVNVLRAQGARARVLSLARGEHWEKKLMDAGVDVVWIGQSAHRTARLRRLIRELRAQKTDVLQSAHFFTNLYAVAAARLMGVREVGAIRSDAINDVRETGWLGIPSLRMPRIIAANSRRGMANARQLGAEPERLRFLPNATDTRRFRPAPRRRAPSMRLLAAGRLVLLKRFDRFLRVVAAARTAGVDVRGLIVAPASPGDSQRVALERLAADLHLLPEHVEFRWSEDTMELAYTDADVLVLTSDFEGTPNVVLEALASGLPVVAPRIGGVPEIVQDGVTGFLVPSGDEDAVVAAVIRLARSPELRMRMSSWGRQYIEQVHSFDRLAASLRDL